MTPSVWLVLGSWACLSPLVCPPSAALFTSAREKRSDENGDVLTALNRIAQALDSQERHTTLYERVAMLEERLNRKTVNEIKLESEVIELKAKIPGLEAEIKTIPEMRKDLAEFEAKIEKLVHDYEAKLSTLASEVIRLKKYGARRKDLQILSDGSDNILLRADAPVCPEVGLGMAAERVGDHCLYFSWGTALNWTAAHRHCQSLGGDLSAPQDLFPLKTFLHRAFARGPSIWLGASYNLDEDDSSNFTDKSLLNSTSRDGNNQSSPIDFLHEETIPMALKILDSDTFSNRIDDQLEVGDNQIHVGENDLISRIALSNEPAAHDRDFLRDARSTVLTSSNVDSLMSRIQDKSLASFVDFILLKDSDTEGGENGNTQNTRRPITESTQSRTSPSDLQEDSALPTDPKILLESSRGKASPELMRDVREILQEGTVDHKAGTAGQKEDDLKGTGKAKMKCMLLQQKESLEYELVGQPCDEEHRFVCEILSSSPTDLKFSLDNLLHE